MQVDDHRLYADTKLFYLRGMGTYGCWYVTWFWNKSSMDTEG